MAAPRSSESELAEPVLAGAPGRPLHRESLGSSLKIHVIKVTFSLQFLSSV